MLRRTIPTLILVAGLAAVAGCDARPPTAPDVAAEGDATLTDPSIGENSSLTFRAPRLSGPDLAQSVRITHEPVGSAPGTASLEVEDDHIRPLQQIFGASTRVGFEPGYAWATGSHKYIGNVGYIDTRAHVTYQNAHLGSQSAVRQDYTPFIIDFGSVKHIWAHPKVYTDHECGLEVQGESDHRAWWQFYQGRSSPEWGVERRTSQASPAKQPGCGGGTGSYTDTETSSGGMVCYYLITYDLDTGEILKAEFLFCATGGTKI